MILSARGTSRLPIRAAIATRTAFATMGLPATTAAAPMAIATAMAPFGRAPSFIRCHSHGHGSIWKSALVHTVQVTLFIFVITLVLEFVIDGVGEDVFATFLLAHPDQAVLYSALVGLIPNCAASVLISELYLQGALGSGAMISGLLVGAGVGLLVLFRANRPMRSNLGIVALLFFVAVLCGFIVNLSGFVF